LKIVFLGNFEPVHSTESHHRKAWQKLGHEVVALQENKATTDQVVEACKDAQVLQYTHTHSFTTPGKILLTEMLDSVHQMGVKSMAFHLDVFLGLEQWDHRDSLIGKHPSWRVQYYFSTVGSKQAEFRKRHVNHFYLPPGVDADGCYEGVSQPHLQVDVGFAGSVNYHPEWQFRKTLVETLQSHYGPRFRVFQGYRERALNDLYASVKVMVGDHCFAGEPLYWSDRLPETCGRGGFIVYPKTEGMTIPTATYTPQNVGDLIAKIDYYLKCFEEREAIRKRCFEHVKNNDTYTHRMRTITEVMGLS
jgi:hypothetical protein